MEIVKLADWSKVLGTRLLGEQIRKHIEQLLEQGEPVKLDFTGIEAASPSFVDECVGKLFLERGQEEMEGRLTVAGASPDTQALIRRMIRERLREKRSHSEAAGSLAETDTIALDPFAILSAVQQDYLTYVRTFQRFQNTTISDWVLERVQSGTLLWKPPFVQISRPFAPGDELEGLVAEGLLHPAAPPIFRRNPNELASLPVYPYHHQTEAVRRILAGRNVVVATGTGSGKSFAFGIPIISQALRGRDERTSGIKAVIVYPMNALANSQYDDFARRLHGTGLRIALYTGDTAYAPAEALEQYRRATGRSIPYDSEVLSRQEIQERPPDILMTNYVMLELLLTRFEDRKLFAQPGVLRFLVLDEVHTYTGKRGADVAALVRRLKQHTHTVGALRCIATSATVEAPAANSGKGGAAEAIASFATRLFGEPFDAGDVVTEVYASLPDDLPPLTLAIARTLEAGPRTVPQLAAELGVTDDEIQQALLSNPPSPVPKLHAFFSQGRAITACLDPAGPHLNDRGESVCPVCAQEGRERLTFPMVFCRACGQEFYSVAVDGEGYLHPAGLDALDVLGQPGYLYLGQWNQEENPLPQNWLTGKGHLSSRYRDAAPQVRSLLIDPSPRLQEAEGQGREVIFIPAPFLFCPFCGIVHDRGAREFNKLFTFGSVGRSTATDVLVSAQVQNLPEHGRKVIAFSDNRQDTALQAAHLNSLHGRIAFRRALYHTLRESEATVQEGEWIDLADIGLRIFETMRTHGVLPEFRRDRRVYARDRQAEARYQRYLQFVALRELQATHRRTHQNLEDVGLLAVNYNGLEDCAADAPFWRGVPILEDLDPVTRCDVLKGFLDLMRKRLAVAHEVALRPNPFRTEVLERLDESVFVHDDEFHGPIGYSDEAPSWGSYSAYRLTGTNTQMVIWLRRALGVDHGTAVDLVGRIVEKLGDESAAYLLQHTVSGPNRARFDLWMVNADVITLQADDSLSHWICPKCLTVHRFRNLRVCTGSACRTALDERGLEGNYFRQIYTLPLGETAEVKAEEHSGQVSGQERREIEVRFRDPEDPLNVLVCTPTMELGIDIGHLNAVMLRNVPPSPANYAQRAGRAGRSGQPSLITVFAGVGFARGPHDQYFYRFPEKMIAGAIAAPRFRLDSQALIWAHIHSLVLETMGLTGAERLPGKPRDLMDLDAAGAPLYTDWEAAYRGGIERHCDVIVEAVEEAFADEMQRCDWFDQNFVQQAVRGFVDDLDGALDRWRAEYQRLDEERVELNRLLGREGVDPALNRRRVVVEGKLQAMREGEGDWYLYRYLGGEGFLPGYAFPPEATVLSFNDREDELARDPAIALTEYAPGNFVYYRGERYEVTHARPHTRQMQPDVEHVAICPACSRAYVGPDEARPAACLCGQDLRGVHPRQALPLPDAYAQRRARITADEEERLRLGYVLSEHYMVGGRQVVYDVTALNGSIARHAFTLTLEHDGQVLLLNQGVREREGDPRGFTLCGKCHRWLMGEDADEKHVGTPTQRGECPQSARAEDLLKRLWLIKTLRSDLALLDVPLPTGADAAMFYTTLLYTWLRALMVAFNLGESELAGFLAPGQKEDAPWRIVLYETAVGGSGVLASLAEPGRLEMAVARAREMLHEQDPQGGCERACYDCLLSFYNQRDHALLDRTLVLPWLQGLEDMALELQVPEDRFEELAGQCQSELEREVLAAIRERGLPLPDEAQKTIYDGDVPIASADFTYEPRIVVMVDGSPHHRDYVQAADEEKRQRLKALGYRMVVIKGEEPETGLDDLAARVGTR
ncbi:MAG: DEAD/DEAH box helicase [Anaerolineae bacterium]|nr:DEAD/DEAH box helicase [Anaerolineae bacterium]